MNNSSASIPFSQLPECCGGPAACPYHAEVIQLRQQVTIDSLTQLYNAGYFREALVQELERSERTFLPTALIMLDLDHFKQVNDTYGHEMGNAVLIQVAQTIKQSTRKLDIQCRYGGEEFAIILPSTDRFMAINVAERLCQTIAASPVQHDGQELNITASLGLTFYLPGGGNDSTRLIKEADRHLYDAKYAGRNRVHYTPAKPKDSAMTSAEKDAFRDLFGN